MGQFDQLINDIRSKLKTHGITNDQVLRLIDTLHALVNVELSVSDKDAAKDIAKMMTDRVPNDMTLGELRAECARYFELGCNYADRRRGDIKK